MKKSYVAPSAKKVEFVYENHVTAAASNVNVYGDPWVIQKCTWTPIIDDCSVIYNVMARGINNCSYQGDPLE